MADAAQDGRRWAVLLRGVNIGGVRIAMKDLAAALTAAGFADVRTVLASGNVLVTSADDADAVSTRVSAVIRERFGHDVVALTVPLDAVRRAVDRYPFPRATDRHAYVVLGTDPRVAEELVDAAGELDPAVEQVRVDDGLVYWDAPKGETLTTPFGRHYGKRQASGAVTTRNLNTLENILAAG
jgi:uncharacterized protein (DUF1697 family)